MTRVLIAGGYGVVGAWVARELHAAHPDIDIMIAGRNPEKGSALAAELGGRVVRLDVSDPEVGLEKAGSLDLLIAALRDPGENLAIAALNRHAAYTTIAQAPASMSTLAIAANLASRPALVLGHWMAGTLSLSTLAMAKDLGRVERIELAALFDYADPVGPMTTNDSGEFFNTGALIRRDGAWIRVDPSSNPRTIPRGDAPPFEAHPMTVLDVPGLAAVTSAADIRFDLGTGESLGTRSGAAASHDMYLDVWGREPSGGLAGRRAIVSDPRGQAHLTALGVLIGAERLLGLDGRTPLKGGVAFPEDSIDPAYALRRLRDLGVLIDIHPLTTSV